MQIKHFTKYKSIEIALNTPKRRQKRVKIWHQNETKKKKKKTTTTTTKQNLLPIFFSVTAMHSVCSCNLSIWRRRVLEKGPSLTYFWSALDPPLGGVCRKALTQVRDHEYFLSTKFRNYPSTGSVGKADYVFSDIYVYVH